MILNSEQIQFIDQFLKRNDVVYVDIRAEMTDHIATAVEERMKSEKLDFYEVFRNYVTTNKKELFRMNRSIWWFSLQEMKKYFRVLLKPSSLLVNMVLILFFIFFRNYDFYLSFKENLPFYFLMAFLFISVLNMIYFWIIRRERYFFIERNSIVLMVLYWINLILLRPFATNNNLSEIMVVGFSCLCVAYIFYTTRQLNSFLKLRIISNKKQ